MRTVPPSRSASARQAVGTTVVLLVASALLCAQFKVDVLLINVVATVVDGRSRTVANLTIDDFILEEDGQPQTISFLTPSADLPISIGVVLDVSGSMRSKILTAQRALERFLELVHEDDEFFLMTFTTLPLRLVDFTSDHKQLSHALWAGVNVGGGTALYDSLFQGLQLVKQGRYDKKAVLLVTDGEDTTSMTRPDKAFQLIREADMLVYSVGIRGAPGFDLRTNSRASLNSTTVDMEVLKQFGDASGGRAWEIAEATFGKKLDEVLDTLAGELRSQYTISYYPNHPMKDGKWHSVKVSMKNPDYRVRARKEYWGEPDLPASAPRARYAGRPLGDVLQELKAVLNIVWASESVPPTMKVVAEPKPGPPRKILDAILDPNGLRVRSGPGGTLLVVRR